MATIVNPAYPHASPSRKLIFKIRTIAISRDLFTVQQFQTQYKYVVSTNQLFDNTNAAIYLHMTLPKIHQEASNMEVLTGMLNEMIRFRNQ